MNIGVSLIRPSAYGSITLSSLNALACPDRQARHAQRANCAPTRTTRFFFSLSLSLVLPLHLLAVVGDVRVLFLIHCVSDDRFVCAGAQAKWHFHCCQRVIYRRDDSTMQITQPSRRRAQTQFLARDVFNCQNNYITFCALDSGSTCLCVRKWHKNQEDGKKAERASAKISWLIFRFPNSFGRRHYAVQMVAARAVAISIKLTDDALQLSARRDHHRMIMRFDTETHLAALISGAIRSRPSAQFLYIARSLRHHAPRRRAGKVVNRRLPRAHRAKFAHFRADFQPHLHWFEWDAVTTKSKNCLPLATGTQMQILLFLWERYAAFFATLWEPVKNEPTADINDH